MLRECAGTYYSPYEHTPKAQEGKAKGKPKQKHIPQYALDGVCQKCNEIVKVVCDKCYRCEGCFHKPWCDGEFFKVMG